MALSCPASAASSETKPFASSTFDSTELMEEPIACITSTAELIAAFKESMSAFAPPVSGSRRVLASRSLIAPSNEVECSLSSKAQSSRYASCSFSTKFSFSSNFSR
uniref:Uncharacterized protein n=1 Tax=Opuntia streptacantha TaxID=393608 RepID=A0A7C9CEL8_OPUST